MHKLNARPSPELPEDVVVLSKDELLGICDSIIQKRGGELHNYQKAIDDYPLKHGRDAPYMPFGQRNKYVTVQLSVEEKKKLGINQDNMSLQAVADALHPQPAKSLGELLKRVIQDLRYPDRRQTLAKLSRNEARHDDSQWRDLSSKYNEAFYACQKLSVERELRADGRSEMQRAMRFKQAVENNPSEEIYLPTRDFVRLQHAVDTRMSGMSTDSGTDFNFNTKHVLPKGQADICKAIQNHVASEQSLAASNNKDAEFLAAMSEGAGLKDMNALGARFGKDYVNAQMRGVEMQMDVVGVKGYQAPKI